MNMPGFTAEASLYKTKVHYRIAGTPDDLMDSRAILPQLDELLFVLLMMALIR